jgi:SAM-dependent methyltransferase
MHGLVATLVDEIRASGAESVLEVGVGTGRIARPLLERGVRVYGVDIALRMLERLRAQLTETHLRPDLMLADGTALPFADGTFRAVLLFHVLHLVPAWRVALAEARRVLSTAGILVYYYKRLRRDNWQASARKWRQMLRDRGFTPRQRPQLSEIDAALASLGGSKRVRPAALERARMTVGELLRETRERVHSWTWEIPDDVFEDCLREYGPWLLEHFGEAARVYTDEITHELHVWTFAG